MNSRMHFWHTLERLDAGWLSLVMMFKYDSITMIARAICDRYNAELQCDVAPPTVMAIREHWLRLNRKGGGLHGLFMPSSGAAGESIISRVEYIFGEPFSWRWLVPCRP